MENRKIIEIKSYFFEINTIDRSLARMIRGKKSTESANIRFYRPRNSQVTDGYTGKFYQTLKKK